MTAKLRRNLKIDIYSDVVCPWCYIGETRLRQVLESLAEPLDISLSYKTYLLDPGTPVEGVDLVRRLEMKYGMPAAEIFARPQQAAQDVGLNLDFKNVPTSFNSINAHTLLRHAAPEHQGALAQALFEAYFQEGKNIHHLEILLPIARAHGFSAAQVETLLADSNERQATLVAASEAQKLGITGVPTFVFNDRVAFSGAQAESVFRQAIDEALEMDS